MVVQYRPGTQAGVLRMLHGRHDEPITMRMNAAGTMRYGEQDGGNGEKGMYEGEKVVQS